MTRPNYRSIEHWETVNFVSVPGWTARYRGDDGAEWGEPCVGVLVQELRATVESWDEPRLDGPPHRAIREHREDPPFETRVVFAGIDDAGSRIVAPCGGEQGCDQFVEMVPPPEAVSRAAEFDLLPIPVEGPTMAI